ncbi:MAG: HAMP domain-containing histidine kinase [Chloroflexi bacterium]|nr:HAMP domain-containing histidine kinase [Chloroflexota bacterium]
MNSETIVSYARFDDLWGAPAFVLALDQQRDIYAHGNLALGIFTLILVGASAGVALGLMYGLERFFIKRLRRLARETGQISANRDFTQRVTVPGTDEIAAAAASVNVMLDALEQSHRETIKAHHEAVQALTVRERIVANVSHEARTPLSIINLYAETCQRGMYGPVTTKQYEVLNTIRSSGFQLLSFINNLLDEAQLHSGKLHLHEMEFAPRDLVESVKLLAEPLAAKKALLLAFDIAPDLPPLFLGDERRLNQIAVNLVTNAIKFTETGSVEVRLFPRDDAQWVLQVADTGIGIPAQALDHIFEPFWQVDNSDTRPVMTGVGLGLSIVKQLVDLMNGSISIQSELGRGSMFTVTLPLKVAVRSALYLST